MASLNVSGLTTSTYGSFDWQTMVDQLIAADTTPITNLRTEETTNKSRISSLSTLETNLTNLQTDAQRLTDSTLFTGRTASSSDSNWTATAANGTTPGSYSIAVTRLATAAHRVGSGNIASALNPVDDSVSGLTLTTLPTATAVTAGTFTVDGQTVTIALTDSLQDVFDKIHAATGNKVTASYSHLTDKITLANTNPGDSDEIVLGAVNDSSNFLQAMNLANNGANTVSSSTSLGAAALGLPLAQARLQSAIGADSSGNGSFTINGVSIAYNIDTDSLSTVLARINASAAGVTASYDGANDRVVLTNNSTGDIGLGANDVSGGLLGALGLTSGSTLSHGLNAQVSVNGGPTVSSTSNTFTSSILGVPGLSVTVTSATTQTVNVAANTGAMQTAIQNFINDYNTVQSYITSQTSITIGLDGQPQAALLSDNHDIQNWADDLRSRTFASVPGLSGTIKQLSNLGLDFDSSGQLSITDGSTLNDALTNHSSDVSDFFATATTGFGANVKSYLNTLLSATGGLAVANDSLVADNNSIEAQIATMQARLDDERTNLTTAFEAMQRAQNLAQSQLSYLEQLNALAKSNS